MANKTEVEKTPETKQSATQFLEEALLAMLSRPDGLPISIEGEEQPFRLTGKHLTHVKVDSAWIGFTHDGCAFRTKDLKDREAFWSLMAIRAGCALKICFLKYGVLKRPVVETPIKKKRAFTPRARRAYGFSAGKGNLERIELTTED